MEIVLCTYFGKSVRSEHACAYNKTCNSSVWIKTLNAAHSSNGKKVCGPAIGSKSHDSRSRFNSWHHAEHVVWRSERETCMPVMTTIIRTVCFIPVDMTWCVSREGPGCRFQRRLQCAHRQGADSNRRRYRISWAELAFKIAGIRAVQVTMR